MRTVVKQRGNRGLGTQQDRRRNGLEGEARRRKPVKRMRGMEMEEKNPERKRDRANERKRDGNERETKRDGDLGSAYRSGRVTCVPEVGVLAWTNRRATPLSLPPSSSVSLTLLLYLSPYSSRPSTLPLVLPLASSYSFLVSISTRTDPHAVGTQEIGRAHV